MHEKNRDDKEEAFDQIRNLLDARGITSYRVSRSVFDQANGVLENVNEEMISSAVAEKEAQDAFCDDPGLNERVSEFLKKDGLDASVSAVTMRDIFEKLLFEGCKSPSDVTDEMLERASADTR